MEKLCFFSVFGFRKRNHAFLRRYYHVVERFVKNILPLIDKQEYDQFKFQMALYRVVF